VYQDLPAELFAESVAKMSLLGESQKLNLFYFRERTRECPICSQSSFWITDLRDYADGTDFNVWTFPAGFDMTGMY